MNISTTAGPRLQVVMELAEGELGKEHSRNDATGQRSSKLPHVT